MSERRSIRAGLIGFGIGKFYAAALRSIPLYYPDLPRVDLVCVATASETSGQQAIRHFGFQRATTHYRELLSAGDIDIVVIASPNYLHRDMTIDALKAGKAVYVDKPLANNLAEARLIVQIARETGRDAQMIFEVRYCPALRLARSLIDQRRLGDIYAFRGVYYRSSYTDPNKPLRWKGALALSGGGVLIDLTPHLIDLVVWLVGMPDRITAQTRIFVDKRPARAGEADLVKVETDDHVIIQTTLPGGPFGTIEAGRLVTGSVNDMSLEIYGSDGSLRWSLADPNYLYLADRHAQAGERGWTKIPTMQSFPDSALPGADLPMGMMRLHIAGMADFVRRTIEGRPYDPGLDQGLRVISIVSPPLFP